MNNKIIYLLIGANGSGKSFIASLMEKNFGITFIRVEDWAKKIKGDRGITDETYLDDVFFAIEEGIRTSLQQHDKIVFESTGLTIQFDRMLGHLRADFKVITIKIGASDALCLHRVRNRDRSIHIDVSDGQVEQINTLVRKKKWSTDFELNNEHATEEELVKQLAGIIK